MKDIGQKDNLHLEENNNIETKKIKFQMEEGENDDEIY